MAPYNKNCRIVPDEHKIVLEELDPHNIRSPRIFQRGGLQLTKEIDLVIYAFQETVKIIEQKHARELAEVEHKWKSRFELLEANVLRQNYQNVELQENLALTIMMLHKLRNETKTHVMTEPMDFGDGTVTADFVSRVQDKIKAIVRNETQEILSAKFTSQLEKNLRGYNTLTNNKLAVSQDSLALLSTQSEDHNGCSCFCDASEVKENTIATTSSEGNDLELDQSKDLSESEPNKDKTNEAKASPAEDMPKELEIASLGDSTEHAENDVSLIAGSDLQTKSTESTMKAQNLVDKKSALSIESSEESNEVIYISYSGFKKKQRQFDNGQLINFVSESGSEEEEEDDCLVFLGQRDISAD